MSFVPVCSVVHRCQKFFVYMWVNRAEIGQMWRVPVDRVSLYVGYDTADRGYQDGCWGDVHHCWCHAEVSAHHALKQSEVSG